MQLTYLKAAIVDAVNVTHAQCGDARKETSSSRWGLKSEASSSLFHKHHLDVLHLLCAKKVVRLSGVRWGVLLWMVAENPATGMR